MEELMAVPLSSVANYTVSSMASVAFSYYMLSQLFERRHSGVAWFSYFTIKAFCDAHIWLVLSGAHPSSWITSFQPLWTGALSIVSLLMIFYTFKGSYVALCICSTASDMMAGICASFGEIVSHLLFGASSQEWYLVAIGAHTLVQVGVVVIMAIALRRPIVWILRLLRRVSLRNRAVWLCISLVIIAYLSYVASMFANGNDRAIYFAFFLPFFAVMVAALFIFVLRASRTASRRQRVLGECQELAEAYDRTVRDQLRSLERDRAVLDGHERTLAHLELGKGSEGLRARIEELKEEYRRLSLGHYCTQPALDAVLMDGATRLQKQGVDVHVSVAGVSAQPVAVATTAYTLLGLAADAASESGAAMGSQMSLRMRGLGEQVFFRLEMPTVWGALGAWRYLRQDDESCSCLVHERKEDDRRVALVLLEGSPAWNL